jgi:hypothetical protein
VHSLLGDRWGDGWFIPNPGRFEVGIVGDGPIDDVRARVNESGFADVVDLVLVPYTPQQELDALNQLNTVVMPLIAQGKVQTGLGLDDAGLPSAVLWWANNATAADRQIISAAASGLGVSVAVKHVDRPDLFVLAERDARRHMRAKHTRHRTRRSVRHAG